MSGGRDVWLFILEGFFSVVSAEEFGKDIQVRARAEADLDRLRDRYIPTLGESTSLPGRDYPWRAFTTRADLASGLANIANAIDYGNSKSEVASRLSAERAHIYSQVWSDCLMIEQEPPTPRLHQGRRHSPQDRTNEYRSRDLRGEGIWPAAATSRYGGVIFNASGEVLLREPLNHFDGYIWTFAKGGADPGEHPTDTALREVREETGCSPDIVGHLSQGFKGTGSTNFYYLMVDRSGEIDERAARRNGETAAVRWASLEEARRLIARSTNQRGRTRDLATLEAAFEALGQLGAGEA